MFEFSSPASADGGFRARMSERLSRLFEAPGSKSHSQELNRGVLRTELLSEFDSAELSSVALRKSSLRPELCSRSRFVGVRRVDAGSFVSSANTGRQRVCASRRDDLQNVLKCVMPKVKRAASAKLFERMRDRLAHLEPKRVPVSVVRSIVPSVRALVVSRSH